MAQALDTVNSTVIWTVKKYNDEINLFICSKDAKTESKIYGHKAVCQNP